VTLTGRNGVVTGAGRGIGREIAVALAAEGMSHALLARTGTYTGYLLSKRALSVLTESLAQPLAGTGVVVVDLLPGLVRTGMTASMPVWDDVTDWDDPAASARVVVDVARSRYDDRSGTLLDAVALDTDG
jgi:NAD(P)-dependent dehydrogenase (short-subunit alcohol dehydrogenase family)